MTANFALQRPQTKSIISKLIPVAMMAILATAAQAKVLIGNAYNMQAGDRVKVTYPLNGRTQVVYVGVSYGQFRVDVPSNVIAVARIVNFQDQLVSNAAAAAAWSDYRFAPLYRW